MMRVASTIVPVVIRTPLASKCRFTICFQPHEFVTARALRGRRGATNFVLQPSSPNHWPTKMPQPCQSGALRRKEKDASLHSHVRVSEYSQFCALCLCSHGKKTRASLP